MCQTGPTPVHVLILGATSADRHRAARERVPPRHHVVVLDAATLPFVRVSAARLPPPPRVVLVDDIERAFPDNQTGSTRLVLTQSVYLVQKWMDAIGADDQMVATADRAALEQCAPEALQQRGPWRRFRIVSEPRASRSQAAASPQPPAPTQLTETARDQALAPTQLAAAFAVSDPAERLLICRDAAERAPNSAAAWLAVASAYREHRDLRAREALERAAELAPDWDAVHYEFGKLWLALDDLARARDAFARAAALMPTFSAALSNLGATLGELGEPDAALSAFRQALASDPDNPALLSNVGVVSREMGRLDESEAALRQVVAVAADFVFGHYNLGHTLFLAGRYREAVAAYEEGARRDPHKNPQQACRLAMSRLAAGDAARGEQELWAAVNRAAPADREDLLLEAYEIAHALVTAHPEAPPDPAFIERLAGEITKSE
jgi:tetratricopeptide (TPR) repeat protein